MKKPKSYRELKESGAVRRGRSPQETTGAEAEARKERERLANRQRQEARRRAAMVLQHNYKEEFSELYRRELESIQSSD